jgi:hypothetical protein
LAGFLLVCTRRPTSRRYPPEAIRRAAALAPDNLVEPEIRLWRHQGYTLAVSNPTPDMAEHEEAVRLGYSFAARWWVVGENEPDGSYAIARSNERRVELLSDALASRTVWYVITPKAFLASTSQRSLVALLGDFRFDPQALTWMITSGHLGPEASWDRRLQRLPPATRLVLDRQTWTPRTFTTRPPFQADEQLSEASHVERLLEAVMEACCLLEVPIEHWVLPLSGGLDSRTLLLALLATGKRPQTMTWGASAALQGGMNDAFVARRLAERLGVAHRFYATDHSAEPLARRLRRFAQASEGRVEDFAGYWDGLALWRGLADEGVTGIIRGDEPGWGYKASYVSEVDVRRVTGARLLCDFPASQSIHRLDLAPQSWPESLRRRRQESLMVYRDRLYEEFHVPTVLAALTSIKSPYVEVVNPLQSRAPLAAAHALPDSLRSDRQALRRVVASLSPPIPLARADATVDREAYLGSPELREEFEETFASPEAESLFARAVLDDWTSPEATAGTSGLRRRLRGVARNQGVQVAHRLGLAQPVRASRRQLSFRAYLAVRTVMMLSNDAVLLREAQTRAVAAQG